MHRSIARQSLVVICFACTVVLAWAGASAAQHPNIILCMGDDHGWDETGYNRHPHLKTPVLDEMAAAGLRMNRFYSAHPTCSPTRGSVITGRHPNRYGTFAPNYSIRPEEISIAQILGKAGYACGHFGKWHLGPVKATSPTNPGAMGFDQWLSHDNFFELNPYLSRNGGPPRQFRGESSEIIIAESVRFIEQANDAGKPFFVVVWFGSPHEPYSGLDKDLALYEDLPERYGEQVVTLTSNETGRPTQRRLDKVLRERYAEITAMDRAIGQLRQWLDGEGLRQNTLLWYCGDNGSPTGGSVTTPLRGQKGIQQGTTPLVKLMDGRATRNFRNFHQAEITEQDFDGPRVILGNRYKLVIDGQPDGKSARELFDLDNDPAEDKNLFETESHIAKDLQRQLHDWQQSVLLSLTGADYH